MTTISHASNLLRRPVAVEFADSAPPIDPLSRLADRLEALAARHGLTRLAIRMRGEVRFVAVSDIDFADAAGNYCRLWLGGESVRVRRGISDLEQQLGEHRFQRVHRSTLVNLDRIDGLRISERGQYTILMRGGRRLSVGRSYRAALAARLAIDDLGE